MAATNKKDQVIDVAELYPSIIRTYNIFPPLGDAEIWTSGDIKPIEVVFMPLLQSIDDISPPKGEFTVTTRSVMYWPKASCNITEAHETACNHLIGGYYFVNPVGSIYNDGGIRSSLFVPELYQTEIRRRGLSEDYVPSAHFLETTTAFQQQFDMTTYPFEYQKLEVVYAAMFSREIVQLKIPDGLLLDPALLNPSAPNGWTLHSVDCSLTNITGFMGDITFDQFKCEILVGRVHQGWFWMSFLVFFGLTSLSYVSGIGVHSRAAAEAGDDKDKLRCDLFQGMRNVGFFAIGLLLTYIFQVELSPYGAPIGGWPSLAASTQIYILGLLCIFASTFVPIIMSFICAKALNNNDGYVGGIFRVYDYDKLPKVGLNSEDEQPVFADATDAKNVHPTDEKFEDEKPVFREDTVTKSVHSTDENSDVIKEIDVDQPALSKSVCGPGLVAGDSRLQRDKRYAVLSIKEMKEISLMLKIDFYTRTVLISAVYVSALAILYVNWKEYKNAID